LFNTGIDEHGQKVYQKAIELGKDPQAYCDEMSKKWVEFCSKFNISYDNFYRTTSSEHKRLATQFVKDISKYIYEKSYSGTYCEGCEAFKTTKELIDGKCVDHPTLQTKEISEKNFFFQLSGFKGAVPPDILLDNTLKAELDFFVQNAEDISISRENVIWGIPFPESNQTMYVWAEALLNYIFAAGYNSHVVKNHSFEYRGHWTILYLQSLLGLFLYLISLLCHLLIHHLQKLIHNLITSFEFVTLRNSSVRLQASRSP
jgi:methionyl-tRNA synthetase